VKDVNWEINLNTFYPAICWKFLYPHLFSRFGHSAL